MKNNCIYFGDKGVGSPESPQLVRANIQKVQFFTDFYSKEPLEADFEKVLEYCREDKIVARFTELHREARAKEKDESLSLVERQNGKNEADKQKSRMASIVPAAVLSGGRKNSNITGLTGLVLVDVDHLQAGQVDGLMTALADGPGVVFAHRTCSGLGVHIIFHTTVSGLMCQCWHNGDRQAYGKVCRAVGTYMSEKYGVEVDEQCFNPERLCTLCHDPELIYCPDAQPLPIEETVLTVSSRPLSAVGGVKSESVGGESAKAKRGMKKEGVLGVVDESSQEELLIEDVDRYVRRLAQKRCIKFESGSHNDYVLFYAKMFNRSGIGLEEALEWMTQKFSAEYSHTESVVRSVYKNNSEKFGEIRETILRRKSAKKTKSKTKSKTQVVQDYLSDGWAKLRHNVVTGEYEIMRKGETAYRTIGDQDENDLFCEIEQTGVSVSINTIRSVIHSNNSPDYNPFTEYIDALPKATFAEGDGYRCTIEDREGERDYIGELADRVSVDTDKEQFRKFFRKWFVAMVKPLMGYKVQNQAMLIFIGRQGIYKTTFFQQLLPPEWRPYFYTKTDSFHMDKDDKIKLAHNALVCIEEIDGVSREELNQFKSIITLQTIDERPPYGRNVLHMNRLASFCATGNKMKFLVDTTGNRRFLTFYVNSITNPYESPIDYEAVYAQAVAHVHAGLKTWFGGWEVQKIEEMNRRFMRNNIEHDLLLKYYQVLPSDAKAVPESFGNIMAHLSQMTGLKINERKLMEVLQELKVPTVEDSTTTCYMLHQLDAEEINVRRNLKKSMLEENDRAF